MLALHGWARDNRDFVEVLEGLEGIALDLPGFGASPPPESPMGAAGYASMIRPVLSQFDEPPVVVGHSFGGRVAVCLAADPETDVAGLVLAGVPLLRVSPASRPALGYRLMRTLASMNVISTERLHRARRRYGSADYRAAEGVMRGVLVRSLDETYEAEMSGIDPHVDLLWGERDTEVSPEVARRALGIFSDASLMVLPGVGHMVPTEAAGYMRARIETML